MVLLKGSWLIPLKGSLHPTEIDLNLFYSPPWALPFFDPSRKANQTKPELDGIFVG